MNRSSSIKKPSFFIYYLLGPIVCLWVNLKYSIKLKKEKIKKGSIILCPHRSYYDCILAAYAVYPNRPHIVSTTLWFRKKLLGWLFRELGVIPKDQFKNDIIAIKQIVQSLKKGENILLFAEGQMSVFGTTVMLPSGLDKLIQKFKPNVYFIESYGAFLSSTRWNRKFKHGSWEANVKLIMDSNKKDEYTSDIISKRINDCFNNNNEWKYLETHSDLKIKKDNVASGLEHILDFCPKCHELLPFTSNKNSITCNKCGYSLEFLDNSYMFKENKDFKHLGNLFDYERKEFDKLASDPNFNLENIVNVSYNDDDFNMHDKGEYVLTLKNNCFTLKNDKESIVIPKEKIVNIVMNFNKGIELPTEEHTYICNFKDPTNVFLYWNYINR